MSNKRISKNIFNRIGDHCQSLVDDFFYFCEGKIDKVKIITELRDISDPMPPQQEQLRIMFARCDRAWKDYCRFMQLPGESQKLFIKRTKEKWLALGKQQEAQGEENEKVLHR